MDVLSIFLLALILLGLAWGLWCMRCDERTSKQRLSIRNLMSERYSGNEWWEIAHAFDDVAYVDHYRRLLFFRNPAKLYPEELRGAFNV